jgi:hypothetical protein
LFEIFQANPAASEDALPDAEILKTDDQAAHRNIIKDDNERCWNQCKEV